jgi:hypothetical protein
MFPGPHRRLTSLAGDLPEFLRDALREHTLPLIGAGVRGNDIFFTHLPAVKLGQKAPGCVFSPQSNSCCTLSDRYCGP